MPAHLDQQGGQSGKIHFIESTLFILALVAGFAPKCPASGPWGGEVGDTCTPPGGSIGSALKGLTCRRVVDSESLGSWLLVRQAGVWARPGPGPWSHHPLPF